MSLRSKTMTLLVCVFVLYAAVDYCIQRWVVFPNFLALEHDEAVKDIERCRQAIDREIEHLQTLTYDWAAWDDTYEYIVDHNEEYADANFVMETFLDTPLNMVFAYDKQGKVVWGRAFALGPPFELDEEEEYREIELEAFPADGLPPDHPLLDHPEPDHHISGILMTEHGPMFIGSEPICTSENEGPIRGTLVMGRFLNDEIIEMLGDQTRVDFQIEPVLAGAKSPQHQRAIGMIEGPRGVFVEEETADSLAGYTVINDIEGRSALLVSGTIARDISARGADAMNIAVVSLVGAGLATLLLLAFVIQRMVVGPVARLTAHATAIGTSSDLTARLDLKRSDEIGTLAGEFDGMVQQLADSRTQFMEASRRAGMADVAAGVLHNVGNVLNSVNVSTSVLGEKIRSLKVGGLTKAVGLMEEHAADLGTFITEDDRGKQLPAYFNQLAGHLSEGQTGLLDEFQSLRDNVDHVNQIIHAQQAYANASAVAEPSSFADIVTSALAITEPSFSRHGISVERNEEKLPTVLIDRSKILQIIVNLLTNAKEALADGNADSRRITMNVALSPEGTARIEVSDTGVGIEPDKLERIFADGFSTKDGGRGVGLHCSALAAAEMDGTLTARSDGPGRGATFILELPIEPIAERAAA